MDSRRKGEAVLGATGKLRNVFARRASGKRCDVSGVAHKVVNALASIVYVKLLTGCLAAKG